jgi:hypothetical protein
VDAQPINRSWLRARCAGRCHRYTGIPSPVAPANATFARRRPVRPGRIDELQPALAAIGFCLRAPAGGPFLPRLRFRQILQKLPGIVAGAVVLLMQPQRFTREAVIIQRAGQALCDQLLDRCKIIAQVARHLGVNDARRTPLSFCTLCHIAETAASGPGGPAELRLRRGRRRVEQ